MTEREEREVAPKTHEREGYTAQFAVREGRPVEQEPLPAEFQGRFGTQTDYEWKRVYPEPASEEALKEYREGNRALRDDRILDAIDAYRRCLAIEDYPPALQNLAVAYLHEASEASWSECRRILTGIIARFENLLADGAARDNAGLTREQVASVLAPAYRNLAELMTQQGVAERSNAKLQYALELTRSALALHPSNTAWLLELWGIHHILDRHDEGSEVLAEAKNHEGFEILIAHAREKYIALKVKYHAG